MLLKPAPNQIHLFRINHKTTVKADAEINRILSDYGISKHRIIKNSFGKPLYIKNLHNKHLNFNITHTSDLSILILTFMNFAGVDAETIKSNRFFKSEKRIFSEYEINFMKELNSKDRDFQKYKLWTIKEAFLKALGTGLYIPPGLVSVQKLDDDHTKIKVDNKISFYDFTEKTCNLLNFTHTSVFAKIKSTVALENTWFSDSFPFSDNHVCSVVYFSEKPAEITFFNV